MAKYIFDENVRVVFNFGDHHKIIVNILISYIIKKIK